MGVQIRRSFAPLTAGPWFAVEDWRAVGQLARDRILARTLRGVDVDGQAFTPYSPGYLLAKDRAVGAFDAGGYGRVNLQVSGEMLRGIQVVPTARSVELTF